MINSNKILRKEKKHKNLTWLDKFVTSLQEKDFYGELILKFHKGEIESYQELKKGKPD